MHLTELLVVAYRFGPACIYAMINIMSVRLSVRLSVCYNSELIQNGLTVKRFVARKPDSLGFLPSVCAVLTLHKATHISTLNTVTQTKSRFLNARFRRREKLKPIQKSGRKLLLRDGRDYCIGIKTAAFIC